ncbi:MAG: serine/threonine-protein phosphatase [Halioglobus sp.]|nr:serine/threonine-protein phosphatase [Halioglobus sp.]
MPDTALHTIAEIADRMEANRHSPHCKKSALTWYSASRTDVGRVRPTNEDAFLDSSEQRLWAVADGMGGHSRGDYASSTVIEQLRAFPRQSALLANLQDLEARLHKANAQCRNAFRNKQPGTTVAAMLAHGSYCFILWAGDSRVYRLRGDNLEQMTQDHSLAQQKYINGELTKAEKDQHASSHILTRAVGAHTRLRIELDYACVHPGDRYLLCSDGLYNPLQHPDIGAELGQGAPQDACDALVDLALAGGGEDNITAIVVAAAPAN